MRVTGVRARAYRLPLHRAWDGGVDRNDVVVVHVDTDAGLTGTGFSWTPLIGARAVEAVVNDDLAAVLVGGEAHPCRWQELRWHLREAGTSGLTLMALAGVDIALWDLRARARGESLVELVGRRRAQAPTYGSGVNLDYSLPDLVEQVRGWVAAGHRAAKIKVGSVALARDVERVRAVREGLGPDRLLMVDANQRWDVPGCAGVGGVGALWVAFCGGAVARRGPGCARSSAGTYRCSLRGGGEPAYGRGVRARC